ncbi:unnamed protein product [Pleuronectes platessa]|uniref:Uncharacterized protein n=1 Tax=Pleuronectes platessa TaxID=8262 RepID=A0A9N7ZE55_PLEPL|nr:unnamed protein product [Pleuronectes platessa]
MLGRKEVCAMRGRVSVFTFTSEVPSCCFHPENWWSEVSEQWKQLGEQRKPHSPEWVKFMPQDLSLICFKVSRSSLCLGHVKHFTRRQRGQGAVGNNARHVFGCVALAASMVDPRIRSKFTPRATVSSARHGDESLHNWNRGGFALTQSTWPQDPCSDPQTAGPWFWFHYWFSLYNYKREVVITGLLRDPRLHRADCAPMCFQSAGEVQPAMGHARRSFEMMHQEENINKCLPPGTFKSNPPHPSTASAFQRPPTPALQKATTSHAPPMAEQGRNGNHMRKHNPGWPSSSHGNQSQTGSETLGCCYLACSGGAVGRVGGHMRWRS